MKTTKKRPPRKNPYETWDVDRVMAELERLEHHNPLGRSDRWHRTHHLRLLRHRMLDFPEERHPKLRTSLPARLRGVRAGMFVSPEMETARGVA